ncbi:MAG: endolytic transglycosylase MltG [Candidatus Vogelbacteria bacterium]|nr:endolytic transglycosylase MltG [Candidatus Vogelbacteria bacterium]
MGFRKKHLKLEFSQREKKYLKRICISGAVIIALCIVLVSVLTAVVIRMGSPDKRDIETFTTNIDIKNKNIRETPELDQKFIKADSLEASAWTVVQMSGLSAAILQAYEEIMGTDAKVVIVNPGTRKEEVAELLSKKLKWSEDEKADFVKIVKESKKEHETEGYLFPDTYYFPPETKPVQAYGRLVEQFEREVISRYTTSTDQAVDIDLALKIASIIQREAAGRQDMRIVSGVIWNRIFNEMSLDIDATLQYAKGNEKIGWWPRLTSKDKFIDSPYNTYKYEGLPPTPISNPSLASITAALNPVKTEAFFYMHDAARKIHTAKTYKEHLRNIDTYY